MEFSEELRKRNAERCEYLEGHMDSLLESDLPGFFKNVEKRVFLAANDVYGDNTPAMRFFESVLKTGEPHPLTFNEALLYKGVSLITESEAVDLGWRLGFEILHLHNKDVDYYEENNLYGFWESLEQSGMSHENIGRYFERFDDSNI